MRWLPILVALAAVPAAAQVAPAVQGAPPAPAWIYPAPIQPAWNPVAPYITPGQDEAGYRSWYLAAPWRAGQVHAFNTYLATWQVAGILPTWQLFRTATSWHKCGGQPFEVPPTSEWPHIVQTLRYIRDHVIPAVGPVEAVSGYRNPILNACAGGAPQSAHRHYSAIDLVPLRPTNRAELMRTLCRVHARRGTDYEVGLGFYAFLRFHVDTTKFRRWGADSSTHTLCPPIARAGDVASVAQPAPALAQAAVAATAPNAAGAPEPGTAPAAVEAATQPVSTDAAGQAAAEPASTSAATQAGAQPATTGAAPEVPAPGPKAVFAPQSTGEPQQP